MLRIRLVVLMSIAALVAPWLAPCLMAGPAAHESMPCCHGTGPVGPAARPCCTAQDPLSSPLAPSTASTVHSVAPVSLELPAALLAIPQPLRANAASPLPIQPRLLFAVLLI